MLVLVFQYIKELVLLGYGHTGGTVKTGFDLGVGIVTSAVGGVAV